MIDLSNYIVISEEEKDGLVYVVYKLKNKPQDDTVPIDGGVIDPSIKLDLSNYGVVNEKEVDGVLYVAYRNVTNPRDELVVRNGDLADYRVVRLKTAWDEPTKLFTDVIDPVGVIAADVIEKVGK